MEQKKTYLMPNKVKCIYAASNSYTVGQTYRVSDRGHIEDNDGSCVTRLEITTQFGDKLYSGNSDFIPVYTEEELNAYICKTYTPGTVIETFSGETVTLGAYDIIHTTFSVYIGAYDVYDKSTYKFAQKGVINSNRFSDSYEIF